MKNNTFFCHSRYTTSKMKIDNILNKEKSPDKAEKASSDVESCRKPAQYDVIDKMPSVSGSFSELSESQSTQMLKNLLMDIDGGGGGGANLTTSKSSSMIVQSNAEGANNNLNNNNLNRITKNNGSFVVNVQRNNGNVKRNVNKQQLFLCSECNQHFQKGHLFSHIKSVHNKFTCLFCYGFFLEAKSLENHLMKKHKVQNNSFFDEKSLKQYLIPDLSLSNGHTKSIKIVCCKCGSIFDINERYDEHTCIDKTDKIPHIISDSYNENINAAVKEAHSNNIAVTTNKQQPNDVIIQQQQQPQQQQPSSQINENSEHLTTKLVPKITLKIPPRAYQNMMSDDDDSDDEFSSSEESAEEKSNESSLSENEEEAEEVEKKAEISMPSLKLKIKNLASNNPESVLENLPELMESSQHQTKVLDDFDEDDENEEKDADITEQPMDIDSPCKQQEQQKQQQNENEDEIQQHEDDKIQEEFKQIEEISSKIFIDGIALTPAGDDVIKIKIKLDEGLDQISLMKMMKICLRSSFPYCLYCNHARKIVVNGKALAMHFITSHRFHATIDSKTEDEEEQQLHPERIVKKIEQSIGEVESSFFNLDTYDNTNEEMNEGHVTISHDKLYECFQCRFQTSIHKELYLHNRKMHQKLLISCLMCRTPFYSYSELLCHICPGIPHKQTYNDYKFYCCLCNLDDIPSAFRLMIHLRKKHFACDVCLEKCSDQGKLSSHVWKHKLYHLCYRCHIHYRSKADIMKHLFWKHGTEGIECRKCLQKKWPHVYHFCTPPSEFKCNQCELTFTRAIALKIHMRIHDIDGAKYECTELGCEKKFIAKKLLIRHLERHKLEKMADEDAEIITNKSVIIIPEEIPEGCSSRTIPIVFNRLAKKVPKLKLKQIAEASNAAKTTAKEDQQQQSVQDEEKEKKNENENDQKKIMELPGSKLNLSESSDSNSDSDSDSNDDENDKKNSIESLAARLEAGLEDENDEQQSADVKQLKKSSSLTDSEDEICETDEEVKKENVESTKIDESKQDDDEKRIEEFIANKKLHVCQSDHDYATLNFEGDLKNIDEYSNNNNKKSSKDKSIKKPNDPFAEFSSSSSSGGSSDSSSNSSSSSSGSSSGTSTDTMSSSEASTPNNTTNKKIRNKKFTKKRQKKEKKTEPQQPQPEPKDPDDIIYESDLVTNESDTDEDFYDEHPLKLDSNLEEKRKLLSKGDLNDGILENSRPSTPSLPPEEKTERKLKKKKKKEAKRLLIESRKAEKYEKYSHVPQMKTQEANEIRHILQKSQQQPILSIHKSTIDYISVSQVPSIASSATSSRMNSDSENPPNVKRSQRKRVPNKFYGYTDGDESLALLANPNDPFRPIPPPQFTWRKEDLPEKTKSPSQLKVAPLKLNLSNDQLQQQLHSFAVEHKQKQPTMTPQDNFVYNETLSPFPRTNLSAKIIANQHQNVVDATNTASSDDNNSLQISEPKRSKKKARNQASSMYAFHTLETPPVVVNNPPLKFKLSLNSTPNNNITTKVKRKNSTPKNPPAKRRKVEKPKTPSGPKTFMPGSSASFQSMSRFHNGNNSFSSSPQDNLTKKARLEEAIQNTQLYFQRFNYAQVSTDIATKTDDGRVYCYCRRAYDDLQGMIGCDGSNCQIEWFHFECVGILVPPKGNWFCPECQKEQQQQ
jgi:hypothetical protein